MKQLAPSHVNDPVTSRTAAKRNRAVSQRFLVLEALANATAPLTHDEIHERAQRQSRFYTPCHVHALSTRRGVLQSEGLVQKVDNLGLSSSGNPAGRYAITAKGRTEYARQLELLEK